MIGTIVLVGIVAVASIVGTYFFLRNNKQKAAAINTAVNTIGSAASAVGSTLTSAASSKPASK